MKKSPPRTGFVFTKHTPKEQSIFDRLFEVFQELITHTSGDFDEAIDWLRQLDKEYELTKADYTIDDFIEELKERGFIREEFKPDGKGGDGKGNGKGGLSITEKLERSLRKRALEQIFGKIKRSGQGNHKTKYVGSGDEQSGDFRNYQFGDGLNNIRMTESIKNAQINNGAENFRLTENDLVVGRVDAQIANEYGVDD